MRHWVLLAALTGCGAVVPPFPKADAGVDATAPVDAPATVAGDAPGYDSTLPWPCCDPPVGNEPPHHAR